MCLCSDKAKKKTNNAHVFSLSLYLSFARSLARWVFLFNRISSFCNYHFNAIPSTYVPFSSCTEHRISQIVVIIAKLVIWFRLIMWLLLGISTGNVYISKFKRITMTCLVFHTQPFWNERNSWHLPMLDRTEWQFLKLNEWLDYKFNWLPSHRIVYENMNILNTTKNKRNAQAMPC